jgi:hypothetical protein
VEVRGGGRGEDVIFVQIIEIVNPIPLMEKTVSWFKKKNLFAKPLDPRLKKNLPLAWRRQRPSASDWEGKLHQMKAAMTIRILTTTVRKLTAENRLARPSLANHKSRNPSETFCNE